MITPCYSNVEHGFPMYEVDDEVDILSSSSPPPAHEVNSNFLYNLSLLKDKLHQVESLATITFMPMSSSSFDGHHHGMDHPPEATSAIALPSMATLIQEIIVTASSMMFSCQQMSLGSPTHNHNNNIDNSSAGAGGPPAPELGPSAVYFSNHQETGDHDHDHWYGYSNYNPVDDNHNSTGTNRSAMVDVGNPINTANDNHTKMISRNPKREVSPQDYDIVELNAADLLAKYTHHCQVCGKGFKRDANLRMHMRAHGEQYKSVAALISPSKSSTSTGGGDQRSKYSCPQEGCRWNKGHVKFQPLKSMICAKNHYRRSHCPKMYVCKRCGGKHFSVLSDLRTHEKHCGDLKWQCSCGTTFSRKDKLMGHLAVFVGHTSAVRKGEDDLTRVRPSERRG